jgi:hypothetical protein
MMGWTAYRLVYQAKSPVHIGWHTLGYIKLTRYYIPGRNMWASFTDNLTRAGDVQGTEAYEYYGKELLNKAVRLSYFYPSIYEMENIQVMIPQYTLEGLKYGTLRESDFARRFIRSYGQTAILPASNTAEDASLHESEYIAPVTEDRLNVHFMGYVFIHKEARTKDNKTIGWDNKEMKLKDIVSEIFVGGDRKYGWGRLVLDDDKAIPESSDFFGNHINLDSDAPEITLSARTPLPAHLPIGNGMKLKGDIEPLVGREWGEKEGKTGKGFGMRVTPFAAATMCWMPGSVLAADEEKTLKLSEYGILKP